MVYELAVRGLYVFVGHAWRWGGGGIHVIEVTFRTIATPHHSIYVTSNSAKKRPAANRTIVTMERDENTNASDTLDCNELTLTNDRVTETDRLRYQFRSCKVDVISDWRSIHAKHYLSSNFFFLSQMVSFESKHEMTLLIRAPGKIES